MGIIRCLLLGFWLLHNKNSLNLKQKKKKTELQVTAKELVAHRHAERNKVIGTKGSLIIFADSGKFGALVSTRPKA
jgi:hypothetical protein